MKLTQEELNKVLEEAPRNDKGQPVIPDDVFLDNIKDLPNGTRSDKGKLAQNGGYLDPGKKGDPKTIENCRKAGLALQEQNAKRRAMAEEIDLFLKRKDENGVTMQERLVEAMVAKALDGCVGAAEFVRDTVGEKPSESLNLDVMTDGDKELMANLMKRLNDGQGSVKK
jgi:hypothetical protein